LSDLARSIMREAKTGLFMNPVGRDSVEP